MGLPRWLSGKEFTFQCRRGKKCGFDPWVGKITWRRQWQPTPVFLPGESHGQRKPNGLQSVGLQRVRHDWATECACASILNKNDLMETVSVRKAVLYGTEHRRIDAFELWCWRRLLTVPWTARRSNQSILKEISPEYSLEGLMLKLKLQYFGHMMQKTDSFEKDPDAGKEWSQEEKGMTEDETVGWHHRLNGHEFQ